MLPSSSDLTYFIEVAQTMNLSRAAERLGLSQPSLSLSIQRLEHEVGAKLFIRSKKGVSLTSAGKVLLASSRELMQKWEAIREKALASESQVKGLFRIGCHPSVALYSLPGFLPQALVQFKELEVQLLHDLSRKIVERIISLEIDIGIVVNPVKHPDLVIHKLCEDEVTYYTSSVTSNINNNLSSTEKVLICDPDLIQTQSLMKFKKGEFKDFNRYLTTSNLEVVTSLTGSGCGIGIIPGRVAALSNQLKKIPNAPIFRDEICLIYRIENRQTVAVKELSKAIQQTFKK